MNAADIRILVVDDEHSIVELLGEYLATRGHPIKTAASGEEATRLLENHEFELVLSDIKMPGLDGLQLLDHIRAKELPTEVILMTGYGTIDSAIRAMKRGALDYLQKPFKLREVYEVIENAMNRPSQEFTDRSNGKLLPLQQALSTLTSPEDLPAIYAALCSHASTETGANGALVAFREPERQHWVTYQCTDYSAFRKFDLQRAGVQIREGLQSPEDALHSRPGILLVALPFQASVKAKNPPCGLLALSGIVDPDPTTTDIAEACAQLVGDALTRQFLTAHLMASSNQESSLLHKERPSPDHAKRVDTLASSIARTMDLEEVEVQAVAWVARLQDQVPSPEEILLGGALDIMTLGGGGLAMNVLSHLEPALFALSEHHDGTGSPTGMSGEDIPRISQIVAAATWWDHTCVSRRFAPRLNLHEGLRALRNLSGTNFHPEVVQAMIRLLSQTPE
ncbi:MAG: response regulator [Myxococcota bacterium]|nr:response regulator [Myxococcota bacterium]